MSIFAINQECYSHKNEVLIEGWRIIERLPFQKSPIRFLSAYFSGECSKNMEQETINQTEMKRHLVNNKERDFLTSQELRNLLSIRDFTNPEEGPHVFQQIIGQLKSWSESSIGQTHLCRGPKICNVHNEFDLFNIPEGSSERSPQYTYYVDSQHVLRAHTTPVISYHLEFLTDNLNVQNLAVLSPGICFRKTKEGPLKTGTPHKVDLWLLSRFQMLSEESLKELLNNIMKKFLPSYQYNLDPVHYPYVRGALGLSAFKDSTEKKSPVKLLSAGIVRSEILENLNLQAHFKSALVIGLGLERFAMMMQNLCDINAFRQ